MVLTLHNFDTIVYILRFIILHFYSFIIYGVNALMPRFVLLYNASRNTLIFGVEKYEKISRMSNAVYQRTVYRHNNNS